MTAPLLLSAMLTLPHPGLPPGADSLLASALDSLKLTPPQMNFDRNWAPSVALPDSLALLCLQDVFAIPGVLSGEVASASGLLAPPSDDSDGMAALIEFARRGQERYDAALESLSQGYVDSLLALVTNLWADTDNPGPWGGWGAYHLDRGRTPPDTLDAHPDTLALVLEGWPRIETVDPSVLITLAAGLRDEEWAVPANLGLPGVEGEIVGFDLSGPVTWVVGGPGPNRYSPDCDFDLIVDTGGDDVWEAAGCAEGPFGRTVSIAVDLSGNDRYSCPAPAKLAAGVMGLGAVIDLSGNDTYDAGPISEGAGLCGQGILADLAGDDWYSADFFSQGAGCLGEGHLLDFSGNDAYRTYCFGQGFGGPAGHGVLADGSGNDCYLAGFRYSHAPLRPEDNRAMSQGFAMGFRPVVAGGRGLLADFGNGNDTYRAEIFGQGGAYWYGLGMLFDEEGQDCYNAAQYAQGSGIHLASGCLWDGGGDDGYFSRFGPSQGAAHDLSTGFLYDASGMDYYFSDGAQGFSINNSAVIFIDSCGTDTYSCGGDGHGVGSWSRGSASCGVFLDMADDDRYLGRGGDSLSWTDGAYGAGLDAPASIPPEEIPPEAIGNPSELDMDSLFSVASEWDVGENRERVLAHRQELASRGMEAVRYILGEPLNTTDGLALRAMEDVISANADSSLPMMLGLLDSLSGRRLRNTIYLMGVSAGEPARLPLEGILASADTLATRLSAVQALGSIGNPASLAAILPLASDPAERMRRQVAVTAGEIGDSLAIPALEILGGDSLLDVRSAAEFSLRTIRGE